MSQGLALLLQKVFKCSPLIEKDSQMITHNMAVVARGTLDKDCSAVIALLRHAM
jgi:hypothetical protein